MPSSGRSVVTYGAPLLLLGGAGLACWLALGGAQTPLGPMRLAPLPAPTAAPTVAFASADPPPTILEPISPLQAELKNALLPFSHRPLLPGAAFHAAADARPAAAECMTQAIYYEAGREPDAGKRAVAQVILNRASSPAFPHDVCGVVRQGAGRPGCQFTFMCDGSLARRPDPAAWARAREIADQALDGAVDPLVGSATHYHADYVYPTWAPQLEKLVKIGRHIFYRWRGATLSPGPTADAVFAPPNSTAAPALAGDVTSLPDVPGPTSEGPSQSSVDEARNPAAAVPLTQKARDVGEGGIPISPTGSPPPLAKAEPDHPAQAASAQPHYVPHRAIPEGRLEIQPR